jgi:predicted regulator of Ras-like GTPase activity (Roadblock/LC7/MglB family)
MQEHLESIVSSTPGAAGAILMGFDGIAVVQYLAPEHESLDLESTAMELSFRFMELRKAAEALDLGDVRDITLKTDTQAVLCRVLSEEYFVAVVLTETGHFGKGRWMLRSKAEELGAEL